MFICPTAQTQKITQIILPISMKLKKQTYGKIKKNMLN
tara:strand:- start:183 stop:296 length:114 start_codon:yes stop_codon:yes gene_type:complete